MSKLESPQKPNSTTLPAPPSTLAHKHLNDMLQQRIADEEAYKEQLRKNHELELQAIKEQKNQVLNSVINGEMHLALAYAEPQSRFNLSDVVTEAKEDGDNFVINGFKSVVMNGPSANKIIISARTSGTQLEDKGISLFLVDSDIEGLTKSDYKTVDGRKASDINLENVIVSNSCLIGSLNAGFDILDEGASSIIF